MPTQDKPKIVAELTPQSFREALRARGIADSITEFAADNGRSRQSIYFAIENPKRFPLVFRLITKALHE